MKKLIMTLAGIAIIVSASFAQDALEQVNKTDYRERLLFGFKAGANYSDIYDIKGSTFNADAKFGFATGAFVAIPIGKLFGLQPEILYSQKGFKAIRSGLIVGDYKFSRTASFIDVPILFALKPSEFISIVAGPQYSYLLDRKDVYTYGNTSVVNETESITAI